MDMGLKITTIVVGVLFGAVAAWVGCRIINLVVDAQTVSEGE